MTAFRMPSLGADMEDGTLVEWKIRPGEKVHRGDIVAVVETAKGAIEIEIFHDGVVAELLVAPGTKVPVGAVLARLDGAATTTPAAMREAVVVAAPVRPTPVLPQPPAAREAPARRRVTPAARQRTAALGIDLGGLRGTGVDGAICLADLPSPAAAPATRRGGFDPAAMRRAIAAAMGRSKREIPHYYLSQTVDMTGPLARIEALNRDRAPPDRLLPAALILHAVARAVAETPELNGFWEDGAFRQGDGVHVGWAVALRGGGLVAPAIRDADRLSPEALMAALRDIVARARGGGLRSSELTDATITVTSVGDRGAESVLPIIYPPQVAILGIGRIVERPWVVEGNVVPRRVAALTLAGDHRASDGHRGGLLLARIESKLQEAEVP
ncbi:dihydrolipoamide acetyltransferase family protein [Neoroseomonas oryzicola]|uniref:Dihydrolipoamide acetyltransferase component of pyruvate dehydrogenase complex n=1 Tax=Neoroseomonas oryzicola TaxID=535904 RepID=A0A9X9WJV3_9PROT|nr:dihydrolipoamide acetyltransferase family protein [Neoroseomonas oryzicola]MBR0660613.1 2-oxo acid dehydrogenase subunit E2 [Neoroseomonas oryzicola]NKE20028.1 2-oxo acid dehydrogenase subunit E2 [Neoroseomonas oryzicola]